MNLSDLQSLAVLSVLVTAAEYEELRTGQATKPTPAPVNPSAADAVNRIHTKYGTTIKSSRQLRWFQRNFQHIEKD